MWIGGARFRASGGSKAPPYEESGAFVARRFSGAGSRERRPADKPDSLYSQVLRQLSFIALALALCACSRTPEPAAPPAQARNLVIVTIDTLRADRVGAYGYAAARTPAIDALAARGARVDAAFATAPITLPSHASLLSGRYPPGHGARHNGLRVDGKTPLLAETLSRAGFATGAFVSAFPLDKRFGLDRGFSTYSDRLPRIDGRPADERPGHVTVDEALAWLGQHRSGRFFLWIHLFEPHAPYGAPGDTRPVALRYDDEVAEADRQVGRVVDALGSDLASTIFIVTSDHGEAFGEHGEIAHSIFVYDTTLRVPLVIAAPGIAAGQMQTPVSLIDIAPTVTRMLDVDGFDADGIDLARIITDGSASPRALYAESFAPLLDFGWSPLRSIREDGWKYIDAPRPELYRVADDPGETRDLAATDAPRVASMRERVGRYSPATLEVTAPADADARSRLQALGYVSGARRDSESRADPKDRKALAADIARVTSGELRGRDLESALRRILKADPGNPQMHMRLGFVLEASNRCAEATKHFVAAIQGRIPGADAWLGLASCQAGMRKVDQAIATLRDAQREDPQNPVVSANLGILLVESGRPADGIRELQQAITLDPEFHQARFNLAVTYADLGRKADAGREAQELLTRLPALAPQRPEVERLLRALQSRNP